MKSGLFTAQWLWLVPCLLAAAMAVLPVNRSQFSAARWVKKVNNNPDKFHLVATNGDYDFSFTYDPLAADQWRFETGGFIVASPR